jgi:DNA-binding CsgD family transcriptional regulator/PAS domain-containing protein
MDGETFSRTIEAIYDAAASFDCWPTALDQLGKIFECSGVSLVDRDPETMQGRAIGMDPSTLQEYFSTWTNSNIYNVRTPVWQTGAITTDRDILTKSELLRSDYYNGFLKPRDMCSLLRISLRIEDPSRQTISLMRPRAAEEFRESDVKVASILLPHLQRAAAISRRLQETGLMSGAVVELLDDNPTGVVLMTQTGKIVFANRAVRAMAEFADGFVLRQDRIEAPREADDDLLQRLIAGATGRSDTVNAVRGGSLRLARKSGLRDYVVMVAPLRVAAEVFEWPGAVACVLITDPGAAPKRPLTMLRRLYGMTASEARVAERLMTGESPEQVAAALDIKVATARVHLAALFRKTDTHRQGELIRLLLSLPWSDGQAKQN